MSTIPSTTSGSASWPTIPRRVAWPTAVVAMSPTRTGTPCWLATTTWSMSSVDWINPSPRTLKACSPSAITLPPTLRLALCSAWVSMGRVTPWPFMR